MAHTVLDSVTLGYQLLWGSDRQLRAIRLYIDADPDPDIVVDAPHLLTILRETWRDQSAPLLLDIHSLRLLGNVLEHSGPDTPAVVVPQAALSHPTLVERLLQAQRRGAHLLWRGEAGEQPAPGLHGSFERLILQLTADQALQALRADLPPEADPPTSPVQPDQIYEAVPSLALASHCLDRHGAWALAGWPIEELNQISHQQAVQPSRTALARLLRAIDDDLSLDAIESLLHEEPVLTYRFLRYVNSAALGLRDEVESVHRGLMMLGYSVLKAWLLVQQPQASHDPDVQPLRTGVILRAQLMSRLLDAGEEDDLRREVYLCGLLSQIDLLLGEPLTVALQRLPLPQRVQAALLARQGPYAPYLEIAAALESAHTRATHALCAAHQIDLEDVNRSLLRTLAALTV